MPVQLIIRNPLDRDAREYIQRAGVTDAAVRLQLNEFTRGVKALGIWNSLVGWPLRSTQNAGTGTTVHSLGGLGTYNGTLVNGPTWGSNGIAFTNASSQSISTALTMGVGSAGVVYTQTSGVSSALWSNRPEGAWDKGITMFARESSDTLNLIDVGAASAERMRATGTPLFSQHVFTQATATLPGSSVAANTTFRNNKTARSTGSYVLGSTGAVGTPDTAVRIGAGNSNGTFAFFEGTMSFVFFATQNFSSAQQESVYDLYKATLGSGLGLP